MSIDSTDEETDIGKLDDLARGLIVRGDYSEALPYLSKILNVFCTIDFFLFFSTCTVYFFPCKHNQK